MPLSGASRAATNYSLPQGTAHSSVFQKEPAMTVNPWRNVYREALLEENPIMVPRRVDAASKAIQDRLAENCQPLSKREFDDIDGALKILRFLTKQTA